MNTETIFSSYLPIDRYTRLIENAVSVRPVPSVPIKGLDAFLMRQIVHSYPVAPAVLDLSGDATLGALPLFWVAQGNAVQSVTCARASWQPAAAEDWQRWIADSIGPLELSGSMPALLGTPIDAPGIWDEFSHALSTLAPLLVNVAPLGESADLVAAHLTWLLGLRKQTLVFAFPVGETGNSSLIEGALHVASTSAPYRLILLREQSPFFAASQVALLCSRDNPHIDSVLKRIQDLYDGNFNFLNLLELNYKLQRQFNQPQTIKLDASASGGAAEPSGAPSALPPPVSVRAPTLRDSVRAMLVDLARRALGRPQILSRVTFLQCTLPRLIRAGDVLEGSVQIRNDNQTAWNSPIGAKNAFAVSYHWKSEDGQFLVKEGLRAVLPPRVQSGETIQLHFRVGTPNRPGRYVLELDMVQEGVAWFSDVGAPGPSFTVNVGA